MKISFAYKLRNKDLMSVLVMSILIILLFIIKGIDKNPGITQSCESCIQDIGSMGRSGHYEEMLWNGVRHVHNSSNDNLIQFTKPNTLFPDQKNKTTKNCIECHNDKPDAVSESLGDLWVKYPRFDKRTGKLFDFEKAIQYEFSKRYAGTKPFYNDVRITEIMVYAYEKARQKNLVFDVEPDDGKVISDHQLAELGPSFSCLNVFNKFGKPKGDIAPSIVKGCNIFTETSINRPRGYAFWKTKMNCSSCHIDGGSKEYAAHIGDAAVNYPGVYSTNNIIYTNRMRIARCYAHSINEILYGANSEYYKLITLYMAWIAEKSNIPIGSNRQSRGIHNIRGTAARHASIMAGQRAYVAKCEFCHGPAGYGSDRFDNDADFSPPPINGSEAFVHTATLSYSSRLASFILNNMPPGATHDNPVLSAQEALDIAEFINVQTRPSSPNTGNLTVLYNYLANTAMEWWFGETVNEKDI